MARRKNVIWDVTVTDTIADSYLYLSAACARSAAKGATSRLEIKYEALNYSDIFIPLAFETYRPINNKVTKFLQELGRRLRIISDDPRESAFFFQRISITLQRFNAIAFSNTLTLASETEFEAYPLLTLFLTFVFNPPDLYYRGYNKLIIVWM